MSPTRGSKKLQENWHKKKIGITEQEVEKIASLIESADFEVLRWWWKGQPSIDSLHASFLVKRESLAEFIKNYQAVESPAIIVHWHPIGVPVIDKYILTLTTPSLGEMSQTAF